MRGGASASHDSLVAKSKKDDWISSMSREVTNSLLLAEKEAVHVTQITANPTSSRRNGQCLHTGARHGFERFLPMKQRLDLFPTHGQPVLALV